MKIQEAARRLSVLLCFVIPFSIAAIEILFPVLLTAWIIGWVRTKQTVWRLPAGRSILSPLAVYLLLCALSILFSSHPRLSIEGFFEKTLEYLLFFIILADLANHPKMTERHITALLAAAFLVCLYGVVQEWAVSRFVGPGVALDPIRGKPLTYNRMIGPYSNPIDLATFLMVAVLLLLPRAVSSTRAHKALLWPLGILAVGCIIWTESKGAILGLGCGLLLLFLIDPAVARLKRLLIFSFIAATIFFFFKDKDLLGAFVLADPGTLERSIMLDTAWRMIKAEPLVGHGLNTFMANYMSYVAGPNQGPAYAHNCFFQIAAETGLPSLFFFLLSLVRLFEQLLPKTGEPSTRAALTGAAAGLFGFLVQSAFDTNFYSLRQAVLFWALAGSGIGCAFRLLQDQRQRHESGAVETAVTR
ncbi:MAG: O-antigen ligase family protein [Candidatus Omnitrophica bacterium]|nr:O-antigen ligase family protein [Candidatus Omnitrophota bacterium]